MIFFFKFKFSSSNHDDFLRLLFYLFIEVILEGSLFELKKLLIEVKHTDTLKIIENLQNKVFQNLYHKNVRELTQKSTKKQNG